MKWAITRAGYFWPTLANDCEKFARACTACQKHGPVAQVPAEELHAVIKPWPFRGWAMDIIEKIHPLSTKRHEFILVATNYFTKWVEAQPFTGIGQEQVIDFIEKQLIHRFGIPQFILTDRGTMFTGDRMREFAANYGIRLIHSPPTTPKGMGKPKPLTSR